MLIVKYVDLLARRPVLGLVASFLAFIGLIYYAIAVFAGTAGLQSGGLTAPNSESTRTQYLFTHRFVSPNEDLVIAISHPVWTVDTPQYQTAYFDFKSKLEEVVPTIYAIKSYFEYPTIVHSVSSDRKTVEVTARLKTTDTPIDISTYEKASNGSPLTIQFSGNDLINLAISNQLTKDLFVIETVGIPILLVALVLVFGGLMSIIAPVCLVLWSIAAALAILHGMAQLINVTNFATNATTIIGAGLAIDFALFFHVRFKEEMSKLNNDVKASVVRMLETSGRSVTFSAVTLCACLSGLLQFQPFFITTMSAAIMIVAAVAAVGALFIIPCLYLALGERVFYLSTDLLFFRAYSYLKSHRSDSSVGSIHDGVDPSDAKTLRSYEDPVVMRGYWFRTSKFVMTYPWPFLTVLLALLGAMMWVFISKLRLAAAGIELLPVSAPERETIDFLQAEIPSRGASTLDVFMQTLPGTTVTSIEFLTALDTYSTTLSSYPHVIGVQNLVRMQPGVTVAQYASFYANSSSEWSFRVQSPFYISDLRSVSRTSITLDVGSSYDHGPDIVREIRRLNDGSIASLLRDHGLEGTLADNYDLNQSIGDTFPDLIAVLVVAMFLLLFLLSGSIFVPIKALITAALSIVSSFGFIVLIFQEGPANAEKLLNFKAAGILDPLQLLFIFGVSFGLSLDYEVFMLVRIQEIYERTGDHVYSVCAGIELTARVVTSAAILLCIVLAAFLSSKILLLKYIGAGIGITIVLDATVIRSILVPAMMAIAGELTWWAPAPLKKVAEYVNISEREKLPVATVSTEDHMEG